jgi:hypothetical protein
MNKILFTIMALASATPLQAAPLSMPPPPAPSVVRHLQWDDEDGGYYRRDFRPGWGRPSWNRGWHSGQWRQARRDCYRYGDCAQLYAMRRYGGGRYYDGGRYYGRQHRGGVYLQFGF